MQIKMIMRTSLAARANLGLIEENYRRWQNDPKSVDSSWLAFFEGFELGNLPQRNGAAVAAPDKRVICLAGDEISGKVDRRDPP